MKYFGHICNEIRGSFLKVMNNAKNVTIVDYEAIIIPCYYKDLSAIFCS